MGGIVVGVDGSEASRAALAWARDEAALRQTTLAVVFAYEPVGPWFGVGEAMGAPVAAPPSDEEMTGAAHAELDQMIDELGDTSATAGCEGRVETGDPAACLVEASRGADLLVVGTRGRTGLAHALLGSVSAHCVEHAHCPVVVVRTGPAA
jgi:nucleotide-binding universal stress UspA family protein